MFLSKTSTSLIRTPSAIPSDCNGVPSTCLDTNMQTIFSDMRNKGYGYLEDDVTIDKVAAINAEMNDVLILSGLSETN